MFKQVYGDKVVDAWGFMAKLSKRIKFVGDADRNGDNFNLPIDMQFEHGISAAASGVTNSGSATGATAALTTQFLAASAGAMQNAVITPAQLIGRSQVTYEAIARSANTAAAFEKATKRVVKRLGMATMKRLEIQLLHGQRGLGVIESVSLAGAVNTVTITAASWSAGIWAGQRGCTLDVYAPNLTTKRNATTLSAGNLTLTTVTPATRTLVITGAAPGDATFSIGDSIFFETANVLSEMPGLDVVASNTGTLYGINAANFELMGGNIASTSTGVPSLGKILEGASLTVGYGNASGLTVVVPAKAYEIMNTDQAALRVYGAESQGKNGFDSLVFMGQVGKLEVLPHQFQKDGLMHAFVEDEAYRIGSQDVSFIQRGDGSEKLILESSTSPASEMRCYSGQSLAIEQPRHTIVWQGLAYS